MPAKVFPTRMPWVAEAETLNNTHVKIHLLDREKGFAHGYLNNHNSMPQIWALDTGEILSGVCDPAYNLIVASIKETNN